MFEFHDPGRLVDGDLELILVERYPGDSTIRRAPIVPPSGYPLYFCPDYPHVR